MSGLVKFLFYETASGVASKLAFGTSRWNVVRGLERQVTTEQHLYDYVIEEIVHVSCDFLLFSVQFLQTR